MAQLNLSYLFWFVVAGGLGLALGYALRNAIVTPRLRLLREDIERLHAATAETRLRRGMDLGGPF